MPHVDDGILHAYLDGAIDALDASGELPAGMTNDDVVAHLSTCADCRSRLEAERAVRERAGLVLHDVSLPRVEIPPLPVPSRSAAPLPAPRTQRRSARRSLPLSWAASVLLAVGAGWWGSAQWRAQLSDGTVVSQESASLPQSDGVRAAGPAAAGQPASGARSAGEQPAISTAPPSSAEAGVLSDVAGSPIAVPNEVARGASAMAAAPAAAPAVASAAASAAAPVAAPPTSVSAGARTTARRADAEAPPTAANVANEVRSERSLAAADTALPGERGRSTEVAREGRIAGDVASVTSDARLSLQNTRDIAAGALRPMEIEPATVYLIPNAELRAFEDVLLRARRGQLRWDAVDADDAEEIADQLFVIEGAAEPVIEQARDTDATNVRITQTLASGALVELLVWRQEAVAMSEVGNVTTRADSLQQAPRTAAAAPSAARARETPAAPPAATRSFMTKAVGASNAPMVTTGASHILSDGRRELILRSAATPVWVAVRADMTDAEIRELARGLVLFGSRR